VRQVCHPVSNVALAKRPRCLNGRLAAIECINTSRNVKYTCPLSGADVDGMTTDRIPYHAGGGSLDDIIDIDEVAALHAIFKNMNAPPRPRLEKIARIPVYGFSKD